MTDTKTPSAACLDPRLYLIDGSGYIFRAFHALPRMTRTDGTPVNAVYGFCTMMQKLLNDFHAEKMAVIFDVSRKTFRQDIYPAYKAHRPPPPEDLVPQFGLIRDAARAYGLPVIELESFEADDLIASYAKAGLAAGLQVRIVSADKDLMQLVREGVDLYDPMKNISIGREQVLDKFGVPPEKVIDVQALAGDSSDNVPGVPSIGLKTAAQLIDAYGDLETLLEKAPQIKQPKRRDVLIENAELARISKKLVTLTDEAPLPIPLNDLHIHLNEETRTSFLQTQGFTSILARIKSKEPAQSSLFPEPQSQPNSPQEAAEHLKIKGQYTCIQSLDTLKAWIAKAEQKGYVAIDTETDSLEACTAKLVGVSMAIEAGEACYIPIAHIDPQTNTDGGFNFSTAEPPRQIPLADVVAHLKPLLADESILKIGHNLKYDSQVLAQHGIEIKAYDDTMLMSYVLGAGAHGHGLDELALRHFQHKMIAYADVTGSGKSKITFDRVTLDQATDYAAEDADFTLRLWLHLKPELLRQKLLRVYEQLERPLVPVIAHMEQAGVCIDVNLLRAQSSKLGTQLTKLEHDIHELAGHSFNVASPKQLGDILFDKMKLPGGTKGKTGAYSTSHDVLEPLADAGHVIVDKVLDHRALSKLKSTYTDALPEQVNPKTGRVHTSFSMVGAATGRLSSTDPNLQNIPIKTEEGRAIRRAFIAPEGSVLLSVDYSQIELRLVAEAAGIQALIDAFHQGVDIHALTASQVFGIPLSELPPEKRRQAKAINFGIIYGISGFGLAKQIGCSPSEASHFIKQYLERFHELREWMEGIKEFARTNGYVETLFGRRIHITGIREKIAARRASAERQAINAPLQGTAADIMKRAMIRMQPALDEAGLSAKLLLQVHDELIFEVREEEIEATAACVKKVMVDAPSPTLTLKVPLVAEAGWAKNWADAH